MRSIGSVIAGFFRSRLRRSIGLGVIMAALITVTAVTVSSSARTYSLSSSGPSNGLPAVQLPSSSGFTAIRGMTQIISGRIPLWVFKDGAGPYSASHVGFFGSLQQGFVLSSAIRKFGRLNHGLPLPLPMGFASAHPGPAEVFDLVWAFSDQSAAVALLHDPVFMNSEVSGMTALRSAAINDGLAWSIDSAANGGMREFRFAWVRGGHLIEVNIVGAKLTVDEARSVASRAGASS